MRPIKLFCIALAACLCLVGGGAALIAVGYQQGYEPQAYADPVPAVGPAGAVLFDAAAPPSDSDAVEPSAASSNVAPPPPPAAPCVDADGPGPAPCIAAPLDEPRAYLDTAATAKREGWSVLVLVIAFPILVAVGRWVPWLRSGWRALATSTGIAMVAAAANAGLLGGSPYAMLTAAGAAMMLAWQGDRTMAAHAQALRDAGRKVGV